LLVSPRRKQGRGFVEESGDTAKKLDGVALEVEDSLGLDVVFEDRRKNRREAAEEGARGETLGEHRGQLVQEGVTRGVVHKGNALVTPERFLEVGEPPGPLSPQELEEDRFATLEVTVEIRLRHAEPSRQIVQTELTFGLALEQERLSRFEDFLAAFAFLLIASGAFETILLFRHKLP